MYSREFSDRAERRSLPPHYGGTALRHGRAEEGRRADREKHEEEKREDCKQKEKPTCDIGQAEKGREGRGERAEKKACKEGKPPHGGRSEDGFFSLLRGLLHPGEDGGDLLLLLVAILLLTDGCEDEYLPFLLLLMLIVN